MDREEKWSQDQSWASFWQERSKRNLEIEATEIEKQPEEYCEIQNYFNKGGNVPDIVESLSKLKAEN